MSSFLLCTGLCQHNSRAWGYHGSLWLSVSDGYLCERVHRKLYQVFTAFQWGLGTYSNSSDTQYRFAIWDSWYSCEYKIQDKEREGIGAWKGKCHPKQSHRAGNTISFLRSVTPVLLHVLSAFLWILNRVSPELIKQQNFSSAAVYRCSRVEESPGMHRSCTEGDEELNSRVFLF